MAKIIDMETYGEYLSLKKFYEHARNAFSRGMWEKGYYVKAGRIEYCPTPCELELMINDVEMELGIPVTRW